MRGTFRAPDGTQLSFRDEGQGTPVLALAGLTRDGTDFDYLARHLPPCRFIRLDSRGRGHSDWADWQTYTIPQETQDTLALLDHLGISRCAIIGTSRGGLIGMVIAASAHPRLAGLCLVDVGPELQRAGLERIATYVGVEPDVETLTDVADRLPLAMPGFARVPASRWAEEAVRHYWIHDDRVSLTYDPDLRKALDQAMNAPAADLWPLFDACEGLPLALIHGVGSDVLTKDGADEMQRRRPDLIRADVPDRGHVPFLDEPEAVTAVKTWLARVEQAETTAALHPGYP